MKGRKKKIKTLKIGGAVGDVRGDTRWIGRRKRFDHFKGGCEPFGGKRENGRGRERERGGGGEDIKRKRRERDVYLNPNLSLVSCYLLPCSKCRVFVCARMCVCARVCVCGRDGYV